MALFVRHGSVAGIGAVCRCSAAVVVSVAVSRRFGVAEDSEAARRHSVAAVALAAARSAVAGEDFAVVAVPSSAVAVVASEAAVASVGAAGRISG